MSTFTVEILKADTPNVNGRTYTRDVLESIVEQTKDKPPMMGRLIIDSSADNKWGYAGGIPVNLADVSHTVSNIRIEDDVLVGDVKILATSRGNILSEIREAQLMPSIGFSTRWIPAGVGVVDAKGVISDYTIHSVDVVKE